MAYLQAIFTTLWSMWNHSNWVIHQGINPNPFEVVLTASSLSCRYRETFNSHTRDSRNATRPNAEQQPTARQQHPTGLCQLIIKIASARCRKYRRRAFAYNVINMVGVCLFWSS